MIAPEWFTVNVGPLVRGTKSRNYCDNTLLNQIKFANWIESDMNINASNLTKHDKTFENANREIFLHHSKL